MKLLKEWAIVCRTLDSGRQIFIARKGGLFEEEGEFVIQGREFFLFPVYLHQNKEALKPSLAWDLETTAAQEPKDQKIHLRNYARVTDAWKISDLKALPRLSEEHIWSEDFLRQRFEWGTELGLTLLTLRVYRLMEEVVLPMKKKYGGCKSWVTVERKGSSAGMVPVLSDAEFLEKRSRLVSIVSGRSLSMP